MASAPHVPDEELDTVPVRRLPRWLLPVVAAIVALAVGVPLLVVTVGHAPDPSGGQAGPAPDGSLRALTAAPATGMFVALSGGQLSLRRPDGTVTRRRDGVDVGTAADPPVLAVDRSTNSVWVVGAQAGQTTPGPVVAQRFSMPGLRRRHRVPVPLPSLGSAAAVDGALFVAGGGRLYRLPPSGRSLRPVAAATHVERVVADPTRDRVLVTEQRLDGTVVTALAARSAQEVGSAAALPVGDLRVAVVGRQVWTVGAFRHAGWLAQLDPDSLFPRGNLAAGRYRVPLHLVGTGDHSLFVRRGESLTVACLTAGAGRPAGRWTGEPTVPGVITGTGGSVLALRLSGPPRRLPLHGCPG